MHSLRVPPLTDFRTDWSHFRSHYRWRDRNHLRLICHRILNHIGWCTLLGLCWWYINHFRWADLDSAGLNPRWLQLVDMSTPNNSRCYLHLIHQRTCLPDNQPWTPLQIPSIISWHHAVTNLQLTTLSTLLIRGSNALLVLLVNHLTVQLRFHQI